MNSQKFDSAFGLLIYKGKILFLHRDNIPTIDAPDTWCFIGGIPDNNETPEETYIRETKEECNVTITKPKYFDSHIIYNGLRYAYYEFLTEDQVKEIKLGDEGQEVRFFSFEEALKINLAPSTRLFLETFKERIQKLLIQSA